MVIQPRAAEPFDKIIEEVGLEKLAKKLDVSVSTIHNYRRGSAVPDLCTAFKIEDLYKIPARHWIAA